MNKRLAFTLIELLVVIAVIGILSGFIVVSMSGTTDKATIAKSQVFSNSLKNSLMLSLVSEWNLDEGTGQSIIDSWSGGNNGRLGSTTSTDTNDPTWVTSGCIFNNCLDFDGTDDYVAINSGTATLDLTKGYAVEGWAKYDVLTGPRVLIRRYPSDDGGWFILAYRNVGSDTNYIQCVITYTNTSDVRAVLVPGRYIQTNKWYHFVLSVEANGVTNFYINGVVGSLSPTNFKKLGGPTASNTTELYIGGAGWYMDGMIDGVRIYNLPMSSSQVMDNYYAGLNNMLIGGTINREEYLNRINSFAINE
jgi:prepilin-type N-terminal cleavage/methylation domain-containing protein